MNLTNSIINARNADSSLIKNNQLAWKLSDLKSIPKNGLNVLSTFSCGGGSTMGYKLAGFDVIGCVEIDPQMMQIYLQNHNPKYHWLMGVQEFKRRAVLPDELYALDILDGSPPCSSFSMAGSREKKWGKSIKFREGQAVQKLDDLFFDYIDIAKRLQPKVCVAENVTGLIQGNAKGYVKQIFAAFRDAGYSTQLFVLDASFMGVPQKRVRTFFIANRIGKKINLKFNEPLISVADAWRGMPEQHGTPLTEFTSALWWKSRPGESMKRVNGGNGFNNIKLPYNTPANTIASSGGKYHPLEPRNLSELEYYRLQSFPDDFNADPVGAEYVCGMSVPPKMMQRVAQEIERQLL